MNPLLFEWSCRVSPASFPGPGPDGEQPPPGDPARDETAGASAGVPEDDWDGDAELAAYLADVAAGRARIPEEWEVEGPAATISLGDAADVDLAELAAVLGPDGLGALSAAGRLAARAQYLRLAAVAEFTRRRAAQFADAQARGVPPGGRDGEFPAAELAIELVTSANAASDTMGLALDLETRLPATRAALGAGLIDACRARLIWKPTRHLTDADAARADEILARLGPGLRYDALARKAVAVAMKLDPAAFQRAKDRERLERQRVVA